MTNVGRTSPPLTKCSHSSSTSLPCVASGGSSTPSRAASARRSSSEVCGRDRDAGCRRQRVVHRDAVPLAAEVVLGAVGPRHRRRPGDRDRRVLDEVLREVGDAVVVGVRLVRLEHRELGAVRGVGALVAEVAVDLEHPVEPAHDGALEEQLGRDAQVELGVERVGLRHERPGRGAAVLHLQHRRLDLDVSAVGERLPQRRVDLRAGAHGLAGLVAHDQVEEAAAHAALLATARRTCSAAAGSPSPRSASPTP